MWISKHCLCVSTCTYTQSVTLYLHIPGKLWEYSVKHWVFPGVRDDANDAMWAYEQRQVTCHQRGQSIRDPAWSQDIEDITWDPMMVLCQSEYKRKIRRDGNNWLITNGSCSILMCWYTTQLASIGLSGQAQTRDCNGISELPQIQLIL